jgi:hypothetical protein
VAHCAGPERQAGKFNRRFRYFVPLSAPAEQAAHPVRARLTVAARQAIRQASKQESHRTQSFTENPQSFTERKKMALRARRLDWCAYT